MSPLSVLPGRVRYGINALKGCQEKSEQLAGHILATGGVTEATVSHRTGSVLVCFDETRVSRDELELQLQKALQAAAEPCPGALATQPRPAPVTASVAPPAVGLTAGELFLEVALHALLPAPLDLLLPAAATVLRR
jgi:hypothetical protein